MNILRAACRYYLIMYNLFIFLSCLLYVTSYFCTFFTRADERRTRKSHKKLASMQDSCKSHLITRKILLLVPASWYDRCASYTLKFDGCKKLELSCLCSERYYAFCVALFSVCISVFCYCISVTSCLC